MLWHWERDRQSADRAEFPFRPLVSSTVQFLVLELRFTLLLACLLVLLAVGLLAVHAAVFDEAAGRAALHLDGVAPVLATVGADFVVRIRHAAHRLQIAAGV